jgi:hypothetical protein
MSRTLRVCLARKISVFQGTGDVYALRKMNLNLAKMSHHHAVCCLSKSGVSHTKADMIRGALRQKLAETPQ